MGHVTVRIGGVDYSGWHAVSVLRGLEQASASFSCSVSERTTGYRLEPWVIVPGSPCTILLDGEVVITGYVDNYAPRYDAHSHGVELRGRSRTCDFVDGAAIVPGGQFKQLSLGEIADRLAALFGITVTSTAGMPVEGPRPSPDFVGPMPPLHDVQVHQGETCYALLERLARVSGLLITDTAEGNLALTRVGSRFAVAALVQGENILGASADLDCSQRYSEYTVKGQRANTDDRIDRSDSTGAVAGGRTTHASVVVAGWRQIPNGPLWDVNLLVPVLSDWLAINRVLLISAVEFRKDDSGSTTRLELTLPDAYAGEGDTVPGSQPATGGAASGGGDLWNGGSIEAIVKGAGGIFG